MKHVSKFLLGFLIISLFVTFYQIPKVRANPDIEELFVNAFDETMLDWYEYGDSPYLDDTDAGYIMELGTGTDQEGYFDFADSGVGAGVINSVKLSFECCYAVGVKKFKVFVWDGSQWHDKGEVTPVEVYETYGYVDVDVSDVIDSWDKINGCRIYIEEVPIASNYVYIRRCKLKIDYTSDGLQEYSEQFSETASLSASLYVWRALFHRQTESILTTTSLYAWREKRSFYTETTTVTEQLNKWIELARFFTETIIITETSSFAMEILIVITEFIETITVDASLYLWRAIQHDFYETVTLTASLQALAEEFITFVEFAELIQIDAALSTTLELIAAPVEVTTFGTVAFIIAIIALAIGIVALRRRE